MADIKGFVSDLAEAIRERNEIEKQKLSFYKEVFEFSKSKSEPVHTTKDKEDEIIKEHIPYIGEELCIYRTDRDKYAVRPLSWAGEFYENPLTREVVISESCKHLAVFFSKENAEKYVNFVRLRREMESRHEL